MCGRGLFVPSYVQERERRAVGAPMQARTNALLTSALARERTHVRTMRRHERKSANLCKHTRADTPPFACGCVWVRARVRPYIYIIPTKNISQQFFPDLVQKILIVVPP